MDFEPLMNAPLIVQCHVACAMTSLVLAPVMLLRRKGDRLHKLIGRVWVLAMAVTALSSFGITDIRLVGPFSPIHALSLLTLYSLLAAIYEARAGRIDLHKRHITGAAAGLIGAGLFTLLPGRLMSDIVFPDIAREGFAGAVTLTIIALIIWRVRARGAGPTGAA